ncbi:hypothetical protein [Agromyces sp. C10]|uniref:hypothetical protein n=1 Tax=Agromyces sp. C10 TaxID=2935077 RepID=UPI00200AEF15|nr:hypothetical protein [Agromyces sp. C10]MCK8608878.1 hypothetical protein [Agromyces sp. C10]
MIQTILDQFETDEERQAAEDAIRKNNGRAYAEAWQAYEEARSRLMHSLVYEEGSVAATDRVAHRDLTGEERADLTERRIRGAQLAWAEFQTAERAYVFAVDGNMPVEFRQP